MKSKKSASERAIERSISEYYDALTPADREEESLWGEFALSQFPEEES